VRRRYLFKEIDMQPAAIHVHSLFSLISCTSVLLFLSTVIVLPSGNIRKNNMNSKNKNKIIMLSDKAITN